MALVLLIDDSELLLQMLDMVCTQAGHDTVTAISFDDARAAYNARRPDLVVTDLNMPDCSDPVAELHLLGDVPIVVVSGRSQFDLDAFAEERDVIAAISKDAGLPGISSGLAAIFAELS